MKKWKILNSQNVFQHSWYTLRQDTVQLPDGRILDDYFVSVRRDVVLIFALNPEQQVLFVRQYKHGAQKILYELPGGYVDEGEQPLHAAKRELLEETGHTADELQLLAEVHGNPTRDTDTFYLYLAENVIKIQEQSLDHTEDITIECVPLDQIRQLLLEGKIYVASSIAAIYLALERLGQL
jgi:8-oxo-dGTP pyrophosphatase MutT (NUDIX family)